MALDADTGAALWEFSHGRSGFGFDAFEKLVPTPDGLALLAVGHHTSAATEDDFTTILLDAQTGVPIWMAYFNGLNDPDDKAFAGAISLDQTIAYVGGSSPKTGSGSTTVVAYTMANPRLTAKLLPDLRAECRAEVGAQGDVSCEAEEAPTGPDLVVEEVIVDPVAPVEGDAAAITARVHNAGNRDAIASEVCFRVDRGPQFGCGDVPPLGRGESITFSFAWTAVPGLHSIQATADAANDVIESRETNNADTLTLEVPALPVRGVEVSPEFQSAFVRPRGTHVFELDVTNTGNAADSILLSKTEDQKGWVATLSAASLDLAAGESTKILVEVTAPLPGEPFTLTITGASAADPGTTDSAVLEARHRRP